ncbi:MAG TPA: GxxExxY protein [Chthoniobacterales bacterium]
MDANSAGIQPPSGKRVGIEFPLASMIPIEYIIIKRYLIYVNERIQPGILFRKEVYTIVGAALEVLRELGHGIHEKPYEMALAVEFQLRKLPYEQQMPFDIFYKKVKVGRFTPDLVVLGKIIVDTKVIDRITDHERGQILNYLRITSLPVGVILNFRYAKLEWERLVRTER